MTLSDLYATTGAEPPARIDAGAYLEAVGEREGRAGFRRLASADVVRLLARIAVGDANARSAVATLRARVSEDDPHRHDVFRALESFEAASAWRAGLAEVAETTSTNPMRVAGDRRPRELSDSDRMWLQRLPTDPARLTDGQLRDLAIMERDAANRSDLRIIRAAIGNRRRELDLAEERASLEPIVARVRAAGAVGDARPVDRDPAWAQSLARVLAPMLQAEKRRDVDVAVQDPGARNALYLSSDDAHRQAEQLVRETWDAADSSLRHRIDALVGRLTALDGGAEPHSSAWVDETRQVRITDADGRLLPIPPGKRDVPKRPMTLDEVLELADGDDAGAQGAAAGRAERDRRTAQRAEFDALIPDLPPATPIADPSTEETTEP